MNKDYFREPVKVVRLWVHECERVLADRMINDTDMTKFNEFRVTVTKKYFDEVNQVNKLATLLRCRAAAMTVANVHLHEVLVCKHCAAIWTNHPGHDCFGKGQDLLRHYVADHWGVDYRVRWRLGHCCTTIS